MNGSQESQTDAGCRDRKGAAKGDKKSGAEQAEKSSTKQTAQHKIPVEADAKLSFGRIEIDKGKAHIQRPRVSHTSAAHYYTHCTGR